MGNNPDSQALAWMTGVKLNLPTRLARRRGAVFEAESRLAERTAELADRVNQVNYEVQQAAAQVAESREVIRLYEKTILPAARENISSAQSAYTNNKIPFLSLIEAERSLVGLLDEYYEALADYFRRRAALERVIGGLTPPTQVETLPTPQKAPS